MTHAMMTRYQTSTSIHATTCKTNDLQAWAFGTYFDNLLLARDPEADVEAEAPARCLQLPPTTAYAPRDVRNYRRGCTTSSRIRNVPTYPQFPKRRSLTPDRQVQIEAQDEADNKEKIAARSAAHGSYIKPRSPISYHAPKTVAEILSGS